MSRSLNLNRGRLRPLIPIENIMRVNLYRSVLLILLSFSLNATEKPNVLLIMVDDMNTMLSTYGDTQVKTPNLEKLKANGIQFNRAYVQYPQCTASRASMLTGLYPGQNGVTQLRQHFRNYVPWVKTLPQVFKENGYYTARVGKIFHYDVPREMGTDGMDDPISWIDKYNPVGIDRTDHKKTKWLGPRKPKDKWGGGAISWIRAGGSSQEHTDGIATQQAIKILDSKHPKKTGDPFFLAVGYFRPHVPFGAPEKFFDLYPVEKIKFIKDDLKDRDDIPTAALSDDHHTLKMTDDQRREAYQAYFASISFVDEQIGALLAHLELLNLTKSTIVVFVSDHGFLMGQHGLWQKKNLFEESVRTPLIIASPFTHINSNESDALVEIIDIYPTILELTGIAIPKHASGISFTHLLENPDQKFRESAFSQTDSKAGKTRPGFPKVVGYSIRTDRFRYTEWGSTEYGAELYDHSNDKNELNNLISNPTFQLEKIKLQSLLKQRIQEAQTKKR